MAECTSNLNKGRFTSLFFGFYKLGYIVGNLIAGPLIQKVKKTTFYLIMGFIGFTGSVIFLFLKKPIQVISQETPERPPLEESSSVEFKIVAIDMEVSGSIQKESIELKEENLHNSIVY